MFLLGRGRVSALLHRHGMMKGMMMTGVLILQMIVGMMSMMPRNMMIRVYVIMVTIMMKVALKMNMISDPGSHSSCPLRGSKQAALVIMRIKK